MIFNVGGFENVKGKMPVFSYDAGSSYYTLNDEGKDGTTQNWSLELTKSGTLKFSKVVKKIDVFILAGGGAGANTGGTAVGGGGYYKTLTNIDVSKNTEYAIMVGTGATSAGKAGGSSSAFGTTATGGGAATAGAQNAVTCTCKCYQGGSSVIRYATSTSVSEWSYLSSSEASIKLRYPIEYVTVQVSGQNASTIRGSDGNYYHVTIKSEDTKHYESGTNGTGASATKIFDTGDTVSGSGSTGAASRKGQGGGSNVITAGDGIVVIRNAR